MSADTDTTELAWHCDNAKPCDVGNAFMCRTARSETGCLCSCHELYLPPLMYWGYLHQNGTVQLKRWFGDHKDYTTDCEGNRFVHCVIPPFAADNLNDAWSYLRGQIAEKRKKP